MALLLWAGFLILGYRSGQKRTKLRTLYLYEPLGQPEDIAAAAALYLASPAARYVTGQVLVVDGGMTM